MMSSLAMMPWFPRDFIASTLGWNLLERGLYVCLLFASWELGELPAENAELARIAGATEAEFTAAWPRVRRKFEAIASGRLVNKRLEEHRSKSLKIRSARANAGRAGGRASGHARQANTEAKQEANPKQPDVGFATSKNEAPSPSPSSQKSPLPPLQGGSPMLTHGERGKSPERRLRDASKVAWAKSEVARKTSDFGELQRTDPCAAEAVRLIGGFGAIGMSSSDRLPQLRARFREIYEELLSRPNPP